MMDTPLRLSVVIPARDEAAGIGETVTTLASTLTAERIPHEILVVDDASSDGTAAVVNEVSTRSPTVRCIRSHLPPGFGHAVRAGLDHYTGDAVAIFMADSSDSPADLVHYYRVLEDGFDCAFGSRFVKGGSVRSYPLPKLILNRVVNFAIRVMFRHGYNDTTNAFKAYRREVIDNIRPLLSNHFNLTVEMPLKAVTRGHTFQVVPITWTNRRQGASKLKLQEMGSRYMFIVLYVFLEHHLSRGDYRRPGLATAGRPRVQEGARVPDLLEGGSQVPQPDGSHLAPTARVPG
ncbi:MAG TPA: glycosyltransferase family 2 protein [Solirubrobacteraceae bacterium]|jgi:dolichol-phosphate mannosyltransferase|nr:glycosyltransferase family 2 protein [Solirubrobacteraceae bacterium]